LIISGAAFGRVGRSHRRASRIRRREKGATKDHGEQNTFATHNISQPVLIKIAAAQNPGADPPLLTWCSFVQQVKNPVAVKAAKKGVCLSGSVFVQPRPIEGMASYP
jgi:hypothetical protein